MPALTVGGRPTRKDGAIVYSPITAGRDEPGAGRAVWGLGRCLTGDRRRCCPTTQNVSADHPKTQVVVEVRRIVPVPVRGAAVPTIIVPRAAPHHALSAGPVY